MKIKNVEIANFRSYKEPIKISFTDINAIIGKNDIGKSTILEALDIFFNDGQGIIKIDKQDINMEEKIDNNLVTMISVEFSDLPRDIIVDEAVKTTLESEYLLTADKTFKLIKRYNNAGKASVYIEAIHPSNEKGNNLHELNNDKLKKLLETYDITCENRTKNSVMRKAIWKHFEQVEGLQMESREIDITKGESKTINDKIQKFLPVYSLFQADRKNNDTDIEIQDPLKAAIKEILSSTEIQEKLTYVAQKVTESLKEVSNSTLDKINEMDESLFKTLEPNIPSVSDLKWESTFKNVSITGDNNIPINKRGSGVKRIILLNFFRADAERRSRGENVTNVIYAIEEPETSLHDDKQIQLIDSFIKLSKTYQTQIIFTTHSSTVVKQLDFEDLLLITDDGTGNKYVSEVNKDVVPYPSLNEVNYLAFKDISEEYHNELYGIIEENNLLQDYKQGKATMLYKKQLKNRTKEEQKILSEYVRHQIHHPENKNNSKYTRQQLKESIEAMRKFLITKQDEIYIA